MSQRCNTRWFALTPKTMVEHGVFHTQTELIHNALPLKSE